MSNQFSIIIATLGRPSIIKLLNCIEHSSIYPQVVIVSLPTNTSLRLDFSSYSFKLVLIQEEVGQVAQRFAAYSYIRTPLMIQLDDDICFDCDFLLNYVNKFLQLPNNSILAPALFNRQSRRSNLVYPKPAFCSLLYFLASFGNSSPYGKLTASGYSVGYSLLQDRFLDTGLIPVEWCPGACVIHHTSNLLSFNYYKRVGKAYAEDLIHCRWKTRPYGDRE